MIASGAREHEIAPPGPPLDQGLMSLADTSNVLPPDGAAHPLDEAAQPRGRDLIGYVIPQTYRRGPIPYRVLAGVGVVEISLVDEIERFLELGVGLSGEAHDDVGRQGDARDGPA